MGNPFIETSGYLLNIDTKMIMSDKKVKSINEIKEKGQRQFEDFSKGRLNSKPNIPLSVPLSRNNFSLFNINNGKSQNKNKQQMKILRENYNSFLKLYIACQNRIGDLVFST